MSVTHNEGVLMYVHALLTAKDERSPILGIVEIVNRLKEKLLDGTGNPEATQYMIDRFMDMAESIQEYGPDTVIEIVRKELTDLGVMFIVEKKDEQAG
jgi:predicted Zn-dependent protease